MYLMASIDHGQLQWKLQSFFFLKTFIYTRGRISLETQLCTLRSMGGNAFPLCVSLFLLSLTKGQLLLWAPVFLNLSTSRAFRLKNLAAAFMWLSPWTQAKPGPQGSVKNNSWHM